MTSDDTEQNLILALSLCYVDLTLVLHGPILQLNTSGIKRAWQKQLKTYLRLHLFINVL